MIQMLIKFKKLIYIVATLVIIGGVAFIIAKTYFKKKNGENVNVEEVAEETARFIKKIINFFG